MNVQTKYDSLSVEAQKQVDAFIEFVLKQSDKKKATGFNVSSWKKKIKKVSVWDEKDLAVFDENKHQFSQWKVQEW